MVFLAVVAAVVLCWLGLYRYIDEHRDHDNAQMVDLLHLSALVARQDARCLQAIGPVSATPPDPSGAAAGRTAGDSAVALQPEVESRLRYLIHAGMPAHRQATVAGPVDAFEADISAPRACPPAAAPAGGDPAGAAGGGEVGTASPINAARLTADLDHATARLQTAEGTLRRSTARDDVALDAGSALAAVMPGLGLAALLLWRWLRRRRGTVTTIR
ncbi:MAG: hypothetical protein ACRDZ8_03575 [Acidimicrobiales bacterium]